jgi:hypothetical protein
VRGEVDMQHWEPLVRALVREETSPGAVIRALIDELESSWWAGG